MPLRNQPDSRLRSRRISDLHARTHSSPLIAIRARSDSRRSAVGLPPHGPSFRSRPDAGMVTLGTVLLAVWWLIGGVGCGPGTPDAPPMPTSTTSGPAEDQRGVFPASPPAVVPSASTPSLPASPPEQKLVVPAWMAKALHSPDPQVRLQALDQWVQQGRTGAVDPLMLALNDTDERVRTRALQLIEQDWRAEQAAQATKQP